ncbi:MAG: hypothetical protein HND42_05710 [Armatimonadetes bacterium]|nr:hypothetical protein [Armatimonadota bacterium]
MTCTVVDGRMLAENRNGNYRFYRSDALGSTVSLYDSSQNKTDSFTYWPYGETRTSSGSTGTKYKYVGTFGCRTLRTRRFSKSKGTFVAGQWRKTRR